MSPEIHSQLANFIWNICNLLRGPYKRNEYRKVILPLTVLRRFDSLLASTKQAVLEKYQQIKDKPDTVIRRLLEEVSGHRFYNLSKMQFAKNAKHSLLNDPDNLAPNLISYINSFSPNVRAIMERFAFFLRAYGLPLPQERRKFDLLRGRCWGSYNIALKWSAKSRARLTLRSVM